MKILRSLALVSFVIALVLLALVSCGGKDDHVHAFADATCTAPKTCSCGATEGDALGHTSVTDAAVAPTCTETGLTEGSHCSVCETVLVAQTELPANGHTSVTDAAVAPTCTETGLTEGSHCSICETVLVAQTELPANGHTTVTDAAVAPTCTETGLTEGSHCSVCETVLVAQTELPANGHTSVTDAAVAPTCTETGLTEGSHCSVCETVLVAQTELPANGHTSVTDAAVAPTCTETGLTEGSHCSICETVLVAQTVVDALGHTFVDSKCACGAEYVAPEGQWTLTTTLKNGDLVLIGAPAYGKLLSADKVNATSFYNKGVNYSADDFSNVTDAEIFVVTVNEDGTYTFTSLTGDVIALAASYSSLNKDGQHKSWALTDRGDGTFLVKNTGRNTYLEWYSSKNNWSTYTAGNTAEYYLSFYVKSVPAGEDHVHNHISSVTAPTCTEAGYTTYTCSCGDNYKVDGEAATGHTHVPAVTAPTCTEAGYTTYTCSCGDNYKVDGEAATGHTFVDGTCHCGVADPDYVKPTVPAGGSADFDTIVLPSNKPNGDSSYTATYTTTAGWITANSAIQCGGATDMNPQFVVIGSTNADKAVCLNGKTSAPGKITSPTLEGGVSKIVINYTKMFTDTELSVTVTVTDLATGTTYTHVIAKTLPKDEKYVVYTDEWTLETPVSGQFTIEIVNNCPTNQNSNKDRMTILSLEWSAPVHEHEYEMTSTTATCTTAGTATYTCSCGDTYTADIEKLGHVDINLDIECDRGGCTSKVAPPADSTLSVFTANNLGSKLATDCFYYVEGTIVEVLDARNGIFLISDGVSEGTFYFRLPKDADGVSHSSWEIKLVLGDKVRVYGKVNKFSTTTAPNGQYYPAIQGGTVTVLEQHPHDFTFSPAGCSDPAYCACGQSYGEPLGCADTDDDNLCDDCRKNVNCVYEYIEIRTDNNSGVIDSTAETYTWSNDNFDAQVAKGTSTQLYSTAKDHMRVYKGNQVVFVNKNGLAVKTIIVHLTNETQVGYFEKFLSGYTYTTDVEKLTVTIEIDSTETITLINPSNGSTTQIKGVEFGYEKPVA